VSVSTFRWGRGSYSVGSIGQFNQSSTSIYAFQIKFCQQKIVRHFTVNIMEIPVMISNWIRIFFSNIKQCLNTVILFLLQITRLKIASNPFAKGFREASRTRYVRIFISLNLSLTNSRICHIKRCHNQTIIILGKLPYYTWARYVCFYVL
jgi:hypothetical protein